MWYEISSRSVIDRMRSSSDQINRARLLAASTLHSGAWLQAVLLPNLGLALGDETTRISVALPPVGWGRKRIGPPLPGVSYEATKRGHLRSIDALVTSKSVDQRCLP